jgi:hypothetical protein
MGRARTIALAIVRALLSSPYRQKWLMTPGRVAAPEGSDIPGGENMGGGMRFCETNPISRS